METLLTMSTHSKLSDEAKMKKQSKVHCDHHLYPDHTPTLSKLRKLRGQIEGIERMVEERRYCKDILVQFKAALGALRNIEVQVFETHLKNCVRDAMQSQDIREVDKKIKELTQYLSKRTTI